MKKKTRRSWSWKGPITIPRVPDEHGMIRLPFQIPSGHTLCWLEFPASQSHRNLPLQSFRYGGELLANVPPNDPARRHALKPRLKRIDGPMLQIYPVLEYRPTPRRRHR